MSKLRRAFGRACACLLVLASCGAPPERATAPTTTSTGAPATTAAAPVPTVVDVPATEPEPLAPATTATTAAPPTTSATDAPAHPAATSTTARPPGSRRDGAAPQRLVGDISPYAGLGTWVDVYDWSHYRDTTPTVGPDQVDQMAAEGVETLFIQTAKHDTEPGVLEPDLLRPIIDRAHRRGLRVVAWYLPTLEDVDNDFSRLMASAALDVDGIAVDIESRKVADPGERSARLVDLSTRLRQALPGRAIGAIVMPPVQLEEVNPNFWPGFPYQQIAPLYDVWQTMGYWTDRKTSSGYRDPYRYTDENIRRLRANLGNPAAPVSPVGGVGGMGNGDIDAFARAAVENGAIGGSIYDWRTTRAAAWPALRKFRTVPS